MKLKARFSIWRGQLRCAHHWHPADAMIAWECCWCGKEADGMPKNQSGACNGYEI